MPNKSKLEKNIVQALDIIGDYIIPGKLSRKIMYKIETDKEFRNITSISQVWASIFSTAILDTSIYALIGKKYFPEIFNKSIITMENIRDYFN
jgi:hypothetical protein